jgi:ech hydrogenase subunit A
MTWIAFLILFPLIPAGLLLTIKSRRIMNVITVVAAVVICLASIVLAATMIQDHPGPEGTHYFTLTSGIWNQLVITGDIVLALAFLFICRKLPFKRYWIPLLVILQYGGAIYYDLSGRVPETTRYFFIDNLTIVMALVIGVVGSLIAVFTTGYMRRYHEEHPEIPDRTNRFLSTIFLFFFAMYGIIFSQTITWIYFFWEITTLCSFIMIGYSRTEEAIHNSFRALWMLLLGGAAFAGAIIYASNHCGTVELTTLLKMDTAVVMLPVLLICFAGMNKAAQFPFSKWLLGAMVAPTPSSALLHSSTMVKAGVYICIRCAPVLRDTTGGLIVALLGGISFLVSSALGVAQRDGKKVLAYSTIGNLGLIILCAGIGTPLALWAAVMLIIFHGLAKALLFLCVGTVEQQIGNRDIEDMHGLISKMPMIAILMLIGIAGMFLAPFGMLISKWAVLEALARRSPIFPIIVVFGGSLMLFFWGKWMGQLIAVTRPEPHREKGIGIEWVGLGGLAILTVLICAFYWAVGIYLVQPIFGTDPILGRVDIRMVSIMLGTMLLLPLGFLIRRKHLVHVDPYLSGANVTDPHMFMGSLGEERYWWFKNYYLKQYLNEKNITIVTNLLAILLLVLMFLS